MLGAVIREYVPQYYEEITPENIVSVSIMPCTAKKYEGKREQFKMADGRQEIDYVLTTQELGRLIKGAGIDFSKLEGEEPDSPFGKYTGAGTIFGVSGGALQEIKQAIASLQKGELITKDANNMALGIGRHWQKIKVTHLI